MSLKVTRRQLAAALGGAASAAAQTSSSQTGNAPAGDLAEAQKQRRQNAATIAKVQISQTLEPAFIFRA